MPSALNLLFSIGLSPFIGYFIALNHFKQYGITATFVNGDEYFILRGAVFLFFFLVPFLVIILPVFISRFLVKNKIAEFATILFVYAFMLCSTTIVMNWLLGNKFELSLRLFRNVWPIYFSWKGGFLIVSFLLLWGVTNCIIYSLEVLGHRQRVDVINKFEFAAILMSLTFLCFNGIYYLQNVYPKISLYLGGGRPALTRILLKREGVADIRGYSMRCDSFLWKSYLVYGDDKYYYLFKPDKYDGLGNFNAEKMSIIRLNRDHVRDIKYIPEDVGKAEIDIIKTTFNLDNFSKKHIENMRPRDIIEKYGEPYNKKIQKKGEEEIERLTYCQKDGCIAIIFKAHKVINVKINRRGI